jgi:branched-chain amino acid aminotransferase
MPVRVMIDGEIRERDAALVSVFDRGFLYGDSVFETIRTYGGRPFALHEHLARLARSAELVFIELPVPLSQLASEISQLLSSVANVESYIRVMISRGQGDLGLDPTAATQPLRVIIVSDLVEVAPAVRAAGIKTITYRTQRPADATSAEGAKIGNYLAAALAMRSAKAKGALEALIVDKQGQVVEGATSNLFYVRQGALFTPPIQAGILPGITRAKVLDVARQLGISVTYALPSVAELEAADEVFISSSIRELLGVVQIDDTVIASGAVGPVTRSLHERFRQNASAPQGI